MLINEKQLLYHLRRAKNVFLLEPFFHRRRYPPIGLGRISSFLKDRGASVTFGQSFDKGMFDQYDLVCIGTLFTYDSKEVYNAIRSVRFRSPKAKIIVGGVFASLMPEKILKKFDGVHLFKGCSKVLDKCVFDYSIDWEVREELTGANISRKNFNEFGFVFTSRGCPNKCAYCAVWKIEPKRYIIPNWREHVPEDRKLITVMDNNISYFDDGHIEEVIDYLVSKNKKVMFDGGIDCKHLTKEKAEIYGRLDFIRGGCRIAFDRIEEDGVFQKAVEILFDVGIKKLDIEAYCLYGFTDTPKEADYRCRECFKLGVNPYAQIYKPLNLMSRKPYVGKHWTLELTYLFYHFWSLTGYHGRMTFDEFIRDEESLSKVTGRKGYRPKEETLRKWEGE